MMTNDAFDRRLGEWLREDSVHRVPDHLDEVLQRTGTTRQRAWWSSPERWLPMDTTFRRRVFLPSGAGRLLLVAGLILALVALAVLAVGTRQPRLPAPFGLARNGDVVTSRDGDLYLTDRDTSRSQVLQVGDGFDFSPIFSRDGTKLVFLRSDGPPGNPAMLTMMLANADGTGVRAVTPPTQSLDWFDWSPSGRHVAYMASGSLWVVDVTGGEPTRLPVGKQTHYPTWMPPDGAEILYRLESTSPALYAVAPDPSAKPRRLSRTPANNGFDFQSPTVSPDGATLAYTRWSAAAVPRVYALDIASGRETVFPTPAGTGQRGWVTFSPDGTLVAYARIHREGAFQLVVANADGSGGERAIGPRRPGPPDGGSIDASWAFAPDGTALVVRYGDDNRGTTQLFPIDGSAGTDLASGGFEFVDIQRLAP